MTLPLLFDRTIKPYILILSSIFAVSFIVGTLAPDSVRNDVTKAFQLIAESYRGIAGGTLFFFILFNNVMASILILVSGVLFGLVPILAIGSNGFILGMFYRHTAEGTGYSKAGLMVLPHGIFEIPALLIAASYGLWLGVMVIRRVQGKEGFPLRYHIGYASRQYLAVVFPLLIVAAAIETALTVL